MTEFEFISVLISIVFGLGLTHLAQGAFQLISKRRYYQVHLLLTGYTFLVLLLNWWTFFLWKDHTPWAFEELLVLVVWAMWFYVLAIVLYPPELDETDELEIVASQRLYAKAFLGLLATDTAQTASLGTLFTPWYYLPFVGWNALLACLFLLARGPRLRTAVAWVLLVSLVAWSLVVRRFLG